MRNKILFGVAGVACAIASPAQAESYLQFNAGAVVSGEVDIDATSGGASASLDQDLDGGFMGGVVFGDTYEAAGSNTFALEAELLYQSSDIDTPELDAFIGAPLNAQATTWGALANVKYNFMADKMVSPYVGAGIGFGMMNVEAFGVDDDTTNFIWQATTGVVFNISERYAIDVGYKYVSLPQWDDDAAGVTFDIDTRAHAVSAGFRLRF